MPPESPPFTVAVDAGFAEDGVWVIDTRLAYRDGAPPLGSELIGRGRLALLEGIAREAQRGRSLGAARVRVHLEGHDRISFDGPEPSGAA